MLQVLRGPDDWVKSIAVCPNGQHIAAGSADFTVHVYNSDSGETERVIDCGSAVTSVDWSPDFTK